MKTERENDSGTSMHTPEQHANPVLGGFRKIQIPKQHLPIERITFGPKRSTEQASIRSISGRHESLKMMAGDEFVKNCGASKVNIVTSHAHHFLLVGHRVSRERYLNYLTTEKERTHELTLRSHHLHPPGVSCQIGNSDKIVIVDELDRFDGQISNQRWLLSRFDVLCLHILQRFMPVIAITQGG